MITNVTFFCVFVIGSLCLHSCTSHHSYEAQDLKACKFDAIYQLGDSLSDTGNSIIEVPQAFHARLPYGISKHNATGRPSDGLLMIDYIAQSAGLPLLPPYEKTPDATFPIGADFAVAGVTALPTDVFVSFGMETGFTNSTMDVQLGWLKNVLAKKCNGTKEKLKSSVFMIGELGSNDLDRAIFGTGSFRNTSIEWAKANFVPLIAAAIKRGVQTVIDWGASYVVVPSSYAMGCSAGLLSWFTINGTNKLDQYGCLVDYNNLFAYQNYRVKQAVVQARKENPGVTIIYSDLYNAHWFIIKNLERLGFTQHNIACCGIGGKYRSSGALDKLCGAKGVPCCNDPQHYVFWDGGHFSHHANRVLSNYLIREMLPQLHCHA